ncbi:MAG: GAF domain-containing protein [bacterium]
MGWFDKKAWRLRRKVKDLQEDLREAEAAGNFLLEQGLFFAELEAMGDQTVMVFGATNLLASQEEQVIRAFFDRNGFQVEAVRLDKARTGLEHVEIIPPEEVVKIVGRALQGKSYRIIDDTEHERAANLAEKIYPFSALVRAIAILFSEKAQQIISSTAIKQNKEGNRLLHWLPKIVQTLSRKVTRDVVEEAREAFDNAYEQHYLKVLQKEAPRKHITHPRKIDTPRPATPPPAAPSADKERIPIAKFSAGSAPTPQPTKPAQPALPPRPAAPQPAAPPKAESFAAPPSPLRSAPDQQQIIVRLTQACQLAETMMRMYKSLIGANSSRCLHNSEVLLQEINRLFDAAATCLMVKMPKGMSYTIHAQAGKKLVWGERGGEGWAVSKTVIAECLKKRVVVTNESGGSTDPTQSMMLHDIEATAAAPIIVNGDLAGILYLDRRGGMRPFTEEERVMLEKASSIFQDYAELTLGLV